MSDQFKTCVTKCDNFEHRESDEGRIRVVIDGVLSYPHLFTPQKDKNKEDDPGKYNCVILGIKDSDAEQGLREALTRQAKNSFPKLKKLPNSLKDGNEKPDEKGYEGSFSISMNNSTKPKIYIGRKEVDADPDGKFYPGCKVRTVSTLWTQNNEFGKRVNLSLDMVQWLADGERLGGSAPIDAEGGDYLAEVSADLEDEDVLLLD